MDQRAEYQRRSPKTSVVQAITRSDLRYCSTAPWKASPAIPVGITATIRRNASLALLFISLILTDCTEPFTMSRRSRRKYMTVASSVATWSVTSKASPWSGQPKSLPGIMR